MRTADVAIPLEHVVVDVLLRPLVGRRPVARPVAAAPQADEKLVEVDARLDGDDEAGLERAAEAEVPQPRVGGALGGQHGRVVDVEACAMRRSKARIANSAAAPSM